MSARTPHSHAGDDVNRLTELLIDRETDTLSAEGQRELSRLLAAHPEVEHDVVRALSAGAAASVPPALTAKLVASATGYFAAGSSSAAGAAAPAAVARSASPWLLWSGWAVAAAAAIAIVVAFSSGYVRTQRSGKPVTGRAPAEVLAAATEIDRATDAVKAGFKPGTGDFASGYGSVVFSPAMQKGYLRISGLPLNDAKKVQYQLWAVDSTRGSFPVDCGVFDMIAECDLILPFSPRLPLRSAESFFVTREPAGGVVVTQSPLRLSAPVSR